jgi:hypothetical protein
MKAGGREDGESVIGQSDSKEDDNDDPDIDVIVPPNVADVMELTTEEQEHRTNCTWEF